MNTSEPVHGDSSSKSFQQLGLSAELCNRLGELGYESPTAIQQTSIPVLLSGQDLLGQAQTGTGKTAAFALPLLCRIDLSERAPQILVLTPTRELCIQVAEAFQSYARKLNGFHVLPIYGGQSMATQLHQLKRGPHVIVGTPGRVMDHLRRKSLNLESLRSLVLDEADEMLNMGFVEDIEWILEHTPEEKQIALFSATMPEPIRRVANTYLSGQKEIKIKTKTSTVETISQHYWLVSGLHKLDALTRMLEVEEFDACLIFVRTKTATIELAEKLEARGHACAALNGDLSQELRERTIQALKKGTLDIIVATDVAARGLDVDRVSHVINYDIPYDPEAYIHRIGRTGRAGRTGKAILFVSPRERRMLSSIERATKQPIEPFQLPSKKEVSDKRIQRFKEQIRETLDKGAELDFFAPIITELSSENDKSELEIATALCFLLQQDSPFVVEESASAHLKGAREERPKGEFRERHPRDRGERAERGERGRRPRLDTFHDDSDKKTFRIEVGRNHGVKPGNIVGAIANSVGLEGRKIGSIQLYDDFSTVDLPNDLSSEVLERLEDVHVMDRKLQISVFNGEVGPVKGRTRERRAPEKKGFGKKYADKKFASKKAPGRDEGENFSARSSRSRDDKFFESKPWLKNKKDKKKRVRDRA